MTALLERLKNEPVLVKSLLTLVVGLAATFGFDVDAEQLFGILVLLGLVTVPVVRAKVTPVRRV